MRINTSSARSVQNKARGAATGKWMTILARFGYAAKGVVYVLIGVLAVLAGFGHGGSTTDRKGALITLHNQPFGVVLLIIVAIGLLCYALWSFIQAIFDTEGKGHEAKGIIARIGYAAVGVSYLLPAYAA